MKALGYTRGQVQKHTEGKTVTGARSAVRLGDVAGPHVLFFCRSTLSGQVCHGQIGMAVELEMTAFGSLEQGPASQAHERQDSHRG